GETDLNILQIEKLQKEKLELQIFLDLYAQESYVKQTIGQAYEDMQTQNQHLLQQVTERDDYNIKLVSESVKTKQASTELSTFREAGIGKTTSTSKYISRISENENFSR
ncbi:hypothetical protein J5N97_000475, partial [Dioscorea zingiberensis]